MGTVFKLKLLLSIVSVPPFISTTPPNAAILLLKVLFLTLNEDPESLFTTDMAPPYKDALFLVNALLVILNEESPYVNITPPQCAILLVNVLLLMLNELSQTAYIGVGDCLNAAKAPKFTETLMLLLIVSRDQCTTKSQLLNRKLTKTRLEHKATMN